jgi:Na+/proline symporter
MPGLQLLDYLIICTYFAIVILIGVVSSRLVKNREDYLVGGRRFGKILMIFFAFGAGTHADNAVGVAAQSYKFGLSGIWYQWVMLFTLPIYWLIAPVFRRARVLTTADFFERRYGLWFSVLYTIYALFICVTYTSVMLYGSSRLVESLSGNQFQWQAIILVISVVSFAYGIAGGLIAAVWNDLFQGVLTIVMSILIIPYFWNHIGGVGGFREALPNQKEIFHLVLSKDMTLYWIIMMSINSLVSMVAQPHIMSNAAAGKSEMDNRVGFVGGLILKRLMTVPWALTGVMAIAMYGKGTIEPDHAFGRMAYDLLPVGCAGLMVACVLASVMDNCAVMMLSFGGLYTNNIYRRLWPKNKDEALFLRVNRIASLVFAFISIPLAYTFTDVPEGMRFAWKVVPLMGIPFLLGLWWRGANRYGALAAFLSSLIALILAEIVFGWTGDSGLPKSITFFLGTGLLCGILVSLITRKERKMDLDRFFLLMNTPVGEEQRLKKAGFVEVPGTGTYEPPPKASSQQYEVEYDRWINLGGMEMSRPNKESVWGFIVVAIIMMSLLGSMLVLADWLSGDL